MNFPHATYGNEPTQLRKIDGKSVVGALGAIVAVLVFCESADDEEIVVNGPGNGLGVDSGFEFITAAGTGNAFQI